MLLTPAPAVGARGVPVKVGRALTTTYHTYFKNGNVLKPTYWFLAQSTSEVDLTPQIEEDIEQVVWMTKEMVTKEVFTNTYPAILDVFKSLESTS